MYPRYHDSALSEGESKIEGIARVLEYAQHQLRGVRYLSNPCGFDLGLQNLILVLHIPHNPSLALRSYQESSYTHLVFEERELGKLGACKLEENRAELEFVFATIRMDRARSNALTISLSSETSGEIPEVEVLALTLATTGLLRELRTLDLPARDF
ncbi:hypothetical protein Tco_1220283 [Tanacetum coccineum]